jgi:hypothetical protein
VRLLIVVFSSFVGWVVCVLYAVAIVVLPARGRRRPDWDTLIGLSRYAILLGLTWPLFGGSDVALNDIVKDRPAVWVPYLGLSLVVFTVVLGANYPRAHFADEREERQAVVAALPLLLVTGAIVLGMIAAPDVRWDRTVPLAMVVAASGLVVGVGRGSWRPLLAPAVVAAAVAIAFCANDVRLQGGIGERVVTASASGTLPEHARLGVGDLTVDLSRVAPRRTPLTVRASVGLGTLKVVLPRGGRIAVDARVGGGTLDVMPHRESGFQQRVVDPDVRYGPRRHHGPARIRLVAAVGAGKIDAHRAGQE